MRVTREKKAENRARIVDTASRLFREKGFDGIGLDAIMKAAGLTHGGFYGHFKSKDDLAAEAVTRALERSAEKQRRFADLGAFASSYLSAAHRADRANGCALAALGGDIARHDGGIRSGPTAYIRAQFERLTEMLDGGTAAGRRKRAIATLAGLVGALTLARAVADPALSEEILAAAREAFGIRPETSSGSRS